MDLSSLSDTEVPLPGIRDGTAKFASNPRGFRDFATGVDPPRSLGTGVDPIAAVIMVGEAIAELSESERYKKTRLFNRDISFCRTRRRGDLCDSDARKRRGNAIYCRCLPPSR
jgi:hypothetical protein